MAHPLRWEILCLLNDRDASPRGMASELGVPVPNVSYHVKILEECGCVELVGTTPRRGAVEHFYRATQRAVLDDEQWMTLPASLRRRLVGQTLVQISDQVSAAAHNDGFDDEQMHVSWTRLHLDERGRSELAELLGRTLDQATRISEESCTRSGNGVAEPAGLAMLCFRPAPETGRQA